MAVVAGTRHEACTAVRLAARGVMILIFACPRPCLLVGGRCTCSRFFEPESTHSTPGPHPILFLPNKHEKEYFEISF